MTCEPRVEAAAVALHRADGTMGKLSWEDWLDDKAREAYRELARSALAAADAVDGSDAEKERLIAKFLRRAADHAALSGNSEWHRGASDAYLAAAKTLQEAPHHHVMADDRVTP